MKKVGIRRFVDIPFPDEGKPPAVIIMLVAEMLCDI